MGLGGIDKSNIAGTLGKNPKEEIRDRDICAKYSERRAMIERRPLDL
jgi:hypothetical protein